MKLIQDDNGIRLQETDTFHISRQIAADPAGGQLYFGKTVHRYDLVVLLIDVNIDGAFAYERIFDDLDKAQACFLSIAGGQQIDDEFKPAPMKTETKSIKPLTFSNVKNVAISETERGSLN